MIKLLSLSEKKAAHILLEGLAPMECTGCLSSPQGPTLIWDLGDSIVHLPMSWQTARELLNQPSPELITWAIFDWAGPILNKLKERR